MPGLLYGDSTAAAAASILPPCGRLLIKDYPILQNLKSPLDLIEIQSKSIPVGVAIESHADTDPSTKSITTYSELWTSSLALGAELQRRQHTPFVAIILPLSSDYIKSMLGVISTGRTFVPLDPAHPVDRIKTILEDLGQPIIITKSSLAEYNVISKLAEIGYPDDKIVHFDKIPMADVASDAGAQKLAKHDAAYCIFTSGSTGTPKGVVIENHSLCHWIAWMIDEFELTRADRSLVFSNPTFDMNISQILPFLSLGSTIVIPSQAIRTNISALHDFVARERISVMYLTTIVGQSFFESTALTHLRWVLFAGEMLKSINACTLPQDLPFSVCNCYGLTEVTISQTYQKFHPGDKITLSVGGPIPNHEIMILDQFDPKDPLGIGQIGEVYIGGVGLPLAGYHNRPETNAKVFVTRDGVRFCRTADLGVWREDGYLEIKGRVDSQIKLRGFRIELGEIEATILSHPDVEQVVAVHDESLDVLRAYFGRRRGSELGEREIGEYLKSRLPAYAVPSSILNIPEFPLTTNGKIDKKALIITGNEKIRRESLADLPSTPTELKVAQIWKGILPQCPIMGRRQTFFELGGNSILIPRLMMGIKGAFPRVSVDLGHLFRYNTIGSLSEFIEDQRRSLGHNLGKGEDEDEEGQKCSSEILSEFSPKIESLLEILGSSSDEQSGNCQCSNIFMVCDLKNPLAVAVLIETLHTNTQSVTCLINCENEVDVINDCINGKISDEYQNKINYWVGDLNTEFFGWGEEEFVARSMGVDALILGKWETTQNAGAVAGELNPIENIFKFTLASYPSIIPIHCISDLSVKSMGGNDYSLDWMIEQMLLQAGDYGYPTTIYRAPTFSTGDGFEAEKWAAAREIVAGLIEQNGFCNGDVIDLDHLEVSMERLEIEKESSSQEGLTEAKKMAAAAKNKFKASMVAKG